jgi:Protein of unknown function (DUF1176)
MVKWLAALFLLLAVPAWAEPVYLDDRSTPQSLIKSLYNAINRKEYARAWDYFSTGPAKDFDTYVKGFADTIRVEVDVGRAGGDGAAGSIFYAVPVAIAATDTKGNTKVFAGCYLVRQVNGTIQDPPSTPLRIEKATLKLSDAYSALGAMPDKCDDVPMPDPAADLKQRAIAQFLAEADVSCYHRSKIESGEEQPDIFPLSYRESYAADSDPPTKMALFSFACGSGAYNTFEAYYLADDINGIQRLSLAEPNCDFKYADEENAKLASMTFKGFTTNNLPINSEFDPVTNTITSFSKWRGIGDASSSGTWVFDHGIFILKEYEIDPTYDGEMNPVSVVKDGQMVAVR